MTSDSEFSLLQSVIENFLRGDSSEFRAIKSRIAWYVSTMSIGPDGEREQIVADVLGMLSENLQKKRFRGDSIKALNFYIYGMVRHRTQNLHRRERRLERNSSALGAIADLAVPVDEILANRDLIRKIVQLLDAKSVRLIRMKFEQGLSDQEIADELDMTRNAVSTAICRCIKKVQNLGIVRDLK
jgi:RNA polymerase sigma factor (sigma-70 family)